MGWGVEGEEICLLKATRQESSFICSSPEYSFSKNRLNEKICSFLCRAGLAVTKGWPDLFFQGALRIAGSALRVPLRHAWPLLL